MFAVHVPSNPDVGPPGRRSRLLCFVIQTIWTYLNNMLNGYRNNFNYLHEESTSPPLNNMLNGEITSTYLHKGWISISDKIYPLHGFHTSSTFEMDMYKELNTAICIYIYIHMTSAHIYIYNIYMLYVHVNHVYFYIYTYFIASTLIKYTYACRRSTDIAFQKYATFPRFSGGHQGCSVHVMFSSQAGNIASEAFYTAHLAPRISYNTACSAFEKNGQWQSALALMEEGMKHKAHITVPAATATLSYGQDQHMDSGKRLGMTMHDASRISYIYIYIATYIYILWCTVCLLLVLLWCHHFVWFLVETFHPIWKKTGHPTGSSASRCDHV